MEDAIQHSLCAHFGATEGWVIETVMTRPGDKGLSVIRARNETIGRDLAVKADKVRWRNADQYRAIKALFDAGTRCVAPYYLDPSQRFFVMDWIDAPLLTHRLGGDDHDAWIRDVGRWLDNLQTVTGREPGGRVKPYRFRLSSRSPDKTVADVWKPLVRRLKKADLYEAGLVRLHGDFHPGNVFCASDGVVVFDPQRDRFGNPFQDVARFLLGLGLARQEADEHGRPWAGDAETDRKSFFDGYGPLRHDRVWLFDLIEEFIVAKTWRRLRRKDREGGPCRYLESELERRGLLGGDPEGVRPGRLVVPADGSLAVWSLDGAEPPRAARMTAMARRAVAGGARISVLRPLCRPFLPLGRR